jgi:hypothetical protein
MLIQNEAPLPENPLATLESDYEQAVVHLAWALHKKTRERTLLFAWTELLPTEVPPPTDDGEVEEQLGSEAEHRLYVRHAVVPAGRAIRWHLGCKSGTAVIPADDGGVPEESEPDARKARVQDLVEEPPWPHLVCVDDREVVPFFPSWHECPRVHHLLPQMDFDLRELWPRDRQLKRALDFLSARLHFEFGRRPEYWGTVHLVAPNPLFRVLDIRRERSNLEGREVLFFRFQPRAGMSVEGLELALRENRPSGIGAVCTVTLHRPTVRIAFDYKAAVDSATVTERARGMLWVSQCFGFFDAFNCRASLDPPRTRIVHVQDGSPYEVPLRGSATQEKITLTGDRGSPQGHARMRSAVFAHRNRGLADGQHWFSGAKEEAAGVLRDLLYGAEREVLIVDPYFGAAEVNGFALAVGRRGVPILVLSSEEILRHNEPPSGNRQPNRARWLARRPRLRLRLRRLWQRNGSLLRNRRRSGIEKGDALLSQLRHVAAQPYTNEISIRVMKGRRPPVHDRFLVVDGKVWILGSSLNEFGARGTMLVALPNPAPIREELFEVWNAAIELEPWVIERKAQRAATAKDPRS